ncbi:MAG: type IV toxin-antitoxin system AbiEi family antitoxin domain-containing protein [Lachnospiraceae bacterium]|jgi:predicted transcriptional regulator of viral defense system|nr:type IV toxin-antitoxin system AbiEi family antitoxin domain-containing protein [Lachnospiraceae bacterium]
MNKFSEIQDKAEKNGGFFLSADADSISISREMLSKYVSQGKLERVQRGVYLLPEYFEDEMFAIQIAVPNAVFSHNTALYLQDLSDRTLLNFEVTIPKGYNGTNLRKKGIDVYAVPKEIHSLGVIEVKTIYGNYVRAYEVERTLCDILKPRAKMDISVVTDAFKMYTRRKKRDLSKLSRYSQILGVEKKVRSYMEVLL